MCMEGKPSVNTRFISLHGSCKKFCRYWNSTVFCQVCFKTLDYTAFVKQSCFQNLTILLNCAHIGFTEIRKVNKRTQELIQSDPHQVWNTCSQIHWAFYKSPCNMDEKNEFRPNWMFHSLIAWRRFNYWFSFTLAYSRICHWVLVFVYSD